MPDPPLASYEFGPFRLDLARRVLLREGERVPLTAKAFEVLIALVELPGEIVEKDRLLGRIWPNTVVEEKNLTVQIAALRKALGETPQEHRFIVTVPGRGYQFVAPVRGSGNGANVSPATDEQEASAASGHDARAQGAPSGDGSILAKRRPGAWWGLAAAVALGAAGLAVALWTRVAEPGRPKATEVRSIAVLPFRALGAEAGNAYLEIGMADVLITRLSGLREIVVRPVSAVRRYGAPDQDAAAAGRELKVDAVLDGHLQHSGDRVRVTVRLIRARDGAPIWADTLDERFTDLFSVQDALSERLVDALALTITGQEKRLLARRDTQNPEAFHAYLKGRHFSAQWTAAGLGKATVFFEQALAADPNHALAHAGLADTYTLLGYLGHQAPRVAFRKAGDSARRALELDEALPEAHFALAKKMLFYDWDLPGAERECLRGLALEPNHAEGHNFYGAYLTAAGDLEHALRVRTRGLDLDPLSPLATTGVGWVYFYQRRYGEAIPWYRKAIELDPRFVTAQNDLGVSSYLNGQPSEAVEAWLQASVLGGASAESVNDLRRAYATSGMRGYWREQLARANRPGSARPASGWRLARLHYELGETDEAFASLERAYAERESLMVFLKVNPLFDRLHPDPRFTDLVRRIGL